MLEAFVKLDGSLQKAALAVIFQDARFLIGLKPADVPVWLRLFAVKNR